jgi:hypothetical protein
MIASYSAQRTGMDVEVASKGHYTQIDSQQQPGGQPQQSRSLKAG